VDATELVGRLGIGDRGHGPRSTRIAAAIADAIDDGRLAVGTVLPSERALAAAMQVSRGTVVRAYGRLREQDLVHTRHGAGTTVGAAGTEGPQSPGSTLRSDGLLAVAGHRDRSQIDLRLAAWDGEPSLVEALTTTGTRLRDAVVGQDGYWPEGLPALREAIATHVSESGLPTDAEQILITGGAQQAIDVVLTSLTRPGDPLLLERITWSGVIDLAAMRHLRPVTLPQVVDDHIPLLRALRERRADLAYLIPTFHNPTSAVLPGPVRRLVVEAAAASGALVIDDASISELWIDRPPPPPLAAAFPGAGANVVTIGGLSKSVWGGLRLGWIRAEGAVLRQLARTKAALDVGNAVVAQLAALAVIERLGELGAARRHELRRRRDAFVTALHTHLPEWGITPTQGGLSLWADLGGVDSDTVAERARRFGVRVAPARVHVVDGSDPAHLRLTLSRPAEELEVAAERLGRAWASLRQAPERSVAIPS
jgi:DNA-binding transcriptional MocR family regulator